MTDYYTENLSEFGLREIKMLNDTLTAWINTGLPEGFDNSGFKPAMNKNSGYVFLTNEYYQVAMLNSGRLELFHTLPYSGHEGFLEDLLTENPPTGYHEDDLEYILNAAELSGVEIDETWNRLK